MKRPVAYLMIAVIGCAPRESAVEWLEQPMLTPQASGTEANFIAVRPVDANVVWASGSRGTWARTLDGGLTWQTGIVEGADSLQFRDVHPFSDRVAYVLSIGSGDQSRIYRTSDGGATWELQFTNDEPAGFFDCFDFWDANSGIAFSDSHDGSFQLITTRDGRTWSRIPTDRLPPATEGEGAFASSGTCVVAAADSVAWVGTGASDGAARVLRTTDRGRTWTIAQTSIARGPSAGITTLAFRDATHGSAIGGDIGRADTVSGHVALTSDGGLTWSPATPTPFNGAAYGSAWVPGAPRPTLVAVGPGGIAWSTDLARSWMPIDTLNHWAVAFAAPDAGWAVGPRGRITRIALFVPAAS